MGAADDGDVARGEGVVRVLRGPIGDAVSRHPNMNRLPRRPDSVRQAAPKTCPTPASNWESAMNEVGNRHLWLDFR